MRIRVLRRIEDSRLSGLDEQEYRMCIEMDGRERSSQHDARLDSLRPSCLVGLSDKRSGGVAAG